MSNNIYNILGKLASLTPKEEPKKEAKPIYESVEAKGSVLEGVKGVESKLNEKYMGFKAVEKAAKKGGAENPAAVAASIGRKKYGKAAFQKAAAAGKKMGESELNEKSVSQAQAHMMAGAAHDPKFAKKVGVKQSVAKEFNKADKGTKISKLPKHVEESDMDKLHGATKAQIRDYVTQLVAEIVMTYGNASQGIKKSDLAPLVDHAIGLVISGESFEAVKNEIAKIVKQAPMSESDFGWDHEEPKEPTVRKIAGKYGTEYQGDADDDEEEQRKFDKGVRRRGRPSKGTAKAPKLSATGEKLGRGRPKKVAEPFTSKSSKEAANRLQSLLVGKLPKTKLAKGRVHRMDESKLTEGCLLDESGATFQHILDTYKRDVKDVQAGGDMSKELYDALYDYYFDDMPYGTKKARTGDPYEWVYQRFCDDLGIDEAVNPDVPAVFRKQAAKPGEDWKATTADIQAQKAKHLSSREGLARRAAELGVDNINNTNVEVESLGQELNELAKLAGLSESAVAECGEMSPFTVTGQVQPEDSLNISTNYDSAEDKKTVTVTAEGEQAEALLQILKMAGLAGGEHAQQAQAVVVAQEAKEYGDTDVKERPVYTNTPDPEVEEVDAIVHQGDDLNKEKKQFAGKPKLGDNPMAKESVNPLESLGNKLLAAYESIKIKK